MVIKITIAPSSYRSIQNISRIAKNFEKLTKEQAKEGAEIYAEALRGQLRKQRYSGHSSSKRGTYAKKVDDYHYDVKTPYYVTILQRGARVHKTQSPKAIRYAQTKGRYVSDYKGRSSVSIGTRRTSPITKSLRMGTRRLPPYLRKSTKSYLKSRGRITA